MLFALPSETELYRAFVARDSGLEGRAFVGVKTTGIFCRLSCPARKPKPENCTFFATVAACLEAGYRPCRRCRPLASLTDADPLVSGLLAKLQADPGRRWRVTDLVALGYDPSTVRRAFRRQMGTTFLDLARLMRLREGAANLAQGEPVITAQLEAGFDSGSGFRAAFAKILGTAPGTLPKDALLRADWIDTPIGPMIAVADAQQLHLLEFFDRKGLPAELARLRTRAKGSLGVGRFEPIAQIGADLEAYFAGRPTRFRTPIQLHGTPFEQRVWTALADIPAGETRSYTQIAQAIGQPQAVRAVARANGRNQLALIIPCHRVIGADGTLTGYAGGLWRKQWLLDLERKA